MKTSVPLLAALLQVPLLALAQSPSSLSETVVTATRVPQPLSELVADVSIVDRETIERSGAVGVADVLARLPGVEITRNGGVGNTTSVFLRGADTRFTAVYVDGVRVDSQSTGGATWESIPLAQIDRIEVLRGPAAAVYGSDAIGGVIQLFTRRGEGVATPYVGFGFGSKGLRTSQAGVSGSVGAFDYSIGAAYQENAGFDVRTPSVANHDPDKDYYHASSANVRLGYQINAQHRIDATVLESETNSGYDNYGYNPKQPVNDRNLYHLRTAGLSWSAQWTEAYSTKLSVTDSNSRYETTPSAYITQTQLRNYLFQNEYRLGASLFTAALERREDKLFNPALDSFSTTIFRKRSQDALALGYGFNQGAHSLQLNVRHDNDSEFGGKTTGSAAYGYSFAQNWRATASAGTAFRAPTLYQRFSEYGNAALQPETSLNAEIGLRYADAATAGSIVAYRNRVRNLITFDNDSTACSSGFGCYANTARAVLRGVTLAGSHHIGDVTLRGSLDFQDPKDAETDKLLALRSRRHATLGADWRVAGWTLGAEIQASGFRYADAANKKTLGGYTLFNLSASTEIVRDVTLLARVDNLGDKNYQLVDGYATPGRAVYVGVKWQPH